MWDEQQKQLGFKTSEYLCVHFERKHDFWCTIPSRGDVLGHQSDLLASRNRGFHTAGKTEIADLEVTIGV